MADTPTELAATDQSLDDFLGAKPPSPRVKYIKWGAVAVGVILLLLLLSRCFGGSSDARLRDRAGAARQSDRHGLGHRQAGADQSGHGRLAAVGARHQGGGRRERPRRRRPAAGADRSRTARRPDPARARPRSPPIRRRSGRRARPSPKARRNWARLESVYKLSGGRVPSAAELADRTRHLSTRGRGAQGRAGQRRRRAGAARRSRRPSARARSSARRSPASCSRGRSIPARPSRRRSTRRRCS